MDMANSMLLIRVGSLEVCAFILRFVRPACKRLYGSILHGVRFHILAATL